jgi:hypothetical protein
MLPFLSTFPAAHAADTAPSGAACTLDGQLSTSGASSIVTSVAREITVPVGNSGVLRFASIAPLGDGGLLRYRKNSEAYISILPDPETGGYDDQEAAFADTDKMTVSLTMASAPGDGFSLSLIDVTTGTLIEAVSIYRA